MPYKVSILADSLNHSVNARLTTFELTYPRFIHAELLTHREFSRNSASSRAIPTRKILDRVLYDPVIPKSWGKNKKGMQASEELTGHAKVAAIRTWMDARAHMVTAANHLHSVGVHKQLANRLVEPWMFITVICSSTQWNNFFYLRDSEFAQPEIAWVAAEMKHKLNKSTPETLLPGDWHLPLTTAEEKTRLDLYQLKKISTARCARVSYLTHDGRRDLQEDFNLHDRLRDNGHWSPFEHVAMASSGGRCGNFRGWLQYRKEFSNEYKV